MRLGPADPEKRRARDAAAAIDLAALARLWPNRTHESNWMKDAICALGLHRWYPVEVSGPNGILKFTFCRWCTKVSVQDADRQASPLSGNDPVAFD